MRLHRHFCGMVAAASEPPFPSMPGHCRHFPGRAPMHQGPAADSKGMEPFAPQERR